MDIKSGLQTSEGKLVTTDTVLTIITTIIALLTTTGTVKVDDQAMLASALVAVFKGIQGAMVLVMYIKSRTEIKTQMQEVG